MKVSQLLLPYLLQHKSLRLQGVGTFKLEKPAVPEGKGKDELVLQQGSVTFTPNKHVEADPEFIAYISKETGKIKPLATSDIESFIEIGKQLLNIDKPFVLDGIGFLQLDARHHLEFIQDETEAGSFAEPGSRKARLQEDGLQFDDDYRHPTNNRKKASGSNAVVLMLMIAGIGLMGYVAWFFYQKGNLQMEQEPPVQAKQLVLSTPPQDSIDNFAPDTISETNQVPLQDSSLKTLPVDSIQGFKIVLEIAKQKRAMKRYADLREWGHKVVMTTSDSIEYKIAIPVLAPLSDTSRYRDSLSHFFGKKVWVEINASSAPR